MLTLYEIKQEYLAALDAFTDPDCEIPEDAVHDTLDGIEHELQEKATNVAMFMRNLEATADAIKDAEAKMAARRELIKSRAQWLKAYLKRNMEDSGITEIESPWFSLSIQKNPPSLEIADEALVPERYKQDVVTVKIDKAGIKAAIKEGADVPGCHLSQGTRLVIK